MIERRRTKQFMSEGQEEREEEKKTNKDESVSHQEKRKGGIKEVKKSKWQREGGDRRKPEDL